MIRIRDHQFCIEHPTKPRAYNGEGGLQQWYDFNLLSMSSLMRLCVLTVGQGWGLETDVYTGFRESGLGLEPLFETVIMPAAPDTTAALYYLLWMGGLPQYD